MQNNVGIYASQISGKLWAPAGAYDALATVTVPSGGASVIEFAGIPTGYKHLQIRGIAFTTSGTDVGCRFGTQTIDSGSNYAKHGVYGTGNGSAGAAGYTSQTYMNVQGYVAGTDSPHPMAFVIDILDYANTSKNKVMRSLAGLDKNANYGEVGLYSGVWLNTSAITRINIVPTGTTFTQYSSFALYGVK
jgi:hypothetical protein